MRSKMTPEDLEAAAGRRPVVERLKCEVGGCPDEPIRFWGRDVCHGHACECHDEVDRSVEKPTPGWPVDQAWKDGFKSYTEKFKAAVDKWLDARRAEAPESMRKRQP